MKAITRGQNARYIYLFGGWTDMTMISERTRHKVLPLVHDCGLSAYFELSTRVWTVYATLGLVQRFGLNAKVCNEVKYLD